MEESKQEVGAAGEHPKMSEPPSTSYNTSSQIETALASGVPSGSARNEMLTEQAESPAGSSTSSEPPSTSPQSLRPGTLPQPRVELKRTLRILVSIPTTQNEDKDQHTRDELYRKLEMYYGSDIKVVLLRPEPAPTTPGQYL